MYDWLGVCYPPRGQWLFHRWNGEICRKISITARNRNPAEHCLSYMCAEYGQRVDHGLTLVSHRYNKSRKERTCQLLAAQFAPIWTALSGMSIHLGSYAENVSLKWFGMNIFPPRGPYADHIMMPASLSVEYKGFRWKNANISNSIGMCMRRNCRQPMAHFGVATFH